ncbi:Copia protein [Vitis vinifera]|uniref:Copia protein n=1 Tax=Vitis vinifera TaxID=29760 RepID=A0A438K0K7_VITVI|nr:Copia protein [Vitis vinifera]
MMGNQVPLNLSEGFVLATCGTNPTHHNLAKEGRKTMVRGFTFIEEEKSTPEATLFSKEQMELLQIEEKTLREIEDHTPPEQKHESNLSPNSLGVKACTQHSIYNHSYDIDYQATFALVAKLDTIQVLLYFEANLDWSLHQLDVKNAFLNDDLEKEMYMKISPGFKTRSNVNKVCKFWKSLYGLKQSHKAWFDRFTKAVKEHEYS